MRKITVAVIFILFIVLVIAGCERNSTQDLRLAIYECDKLELRSIGLHDSEGKLYIECREYKDE